MPQPPRAHMQAYHLRWHLPSALHPVALAVPTPWLQLWHTAPQAVTWQVPTRALQAQQRLLQMNPAWAAQRPVIHQLMKASSSALQSAPCRQQWACAQGARWPRLTTFDAA